MISSYSGKEATKEAGGREAFQAERTASGIPMVCIYAGSQNVVLVSEMTAEGTRREEFRS